MSVWNRFGLGSKKPLGQGKKPRSHSFKPQLDQLETRVVPAGSQKDVLFALEPSVDKQANGALVYDPSKSNYITEEMSNASKIFDKSFWQNYLNNRGEEDSQDNLKNIYKLLFSPTINNKAVKLDDPAWNSYINNWDADSNSAEKNKNLNLLLKGIGQKIKQPIYDTIISQDPKITTSIEGVVTGIDYIEKQIEEMPIDYKVRNVKKNINILDYLNQQSKSAGFFTKLLSLDTILDDKPTIPVFLVSNGIEVSYPDKPKQYPFGFANMPGDGINSTAPITISLSNFIFHGIKTGKIANRDQLEGQLANTIIHEFGHLLGIDHPENNGKMDLSEKNIMSYNRDRLNSTFIDSSLGMFVSDNTYKLGKIQNAGKEVIDSFKSQHFAYLDPKNPPKFKTGNFRYFDEEYISPDLIYGNEPADSKSDWNITDINASIKNLEDKVKEKVVQEITSAFGFEIPMLKQAIRNGLNIVPEQFAGSFPVGGFTSLAELEGWLKKYTLSHVFYEGTTKTLFQAVSSINLNFDANFQLNLDFLKDLKIDQASINKITKWFNGAGIQANGGLSMEFQFGVDSTGAYFVPTGDIVGSLGLRDTIETFSLSKELGLEIDPELNANFLISASLGKFGVRQYTVPNSVSFEVEGDISAGLDGTFKIGDGWAEIPFNFNYGMKYDGGKFNVDANNNGFDLQGFQDDLISEMGDLFGVIGDGARNVVKKLKLPGELTKILDNLTSLPSVLATSGASLFSSLSVLNSQPSLDNFLTTPLGLLKKNFNIDETLLYRKQIAESEFSIGGDGSLLKAKQTFTGSIDLKANLVVKATISIDLENGSIELAPGAEFSITIDPSATLKTAFKLIPGILDVAGDARIGFSHEGQPGLIAKSTYDSKQWISRFDGEFEITAGLKATVLKFIEISIEAKILGKEILDGEFELGDIEVTSNIDDIKNQLLNKIKEKSSSLAREIIQKISGTKAMPDAFKNFLDKFVKMYEKMMPFDMKIGDLSIDKLNKILPPGWKVVITGLDGKVGNISDLEPFANNDYANSDEKFFKIEYPIIDSPAGTIASFLLGQSELELVTAELNPKFEMSNKTFVLYPDVPLFAIPPVDFSGGADITPEISIQSVMKFGIDNIGLYLKRDSKPLVVDAKIILSGKLAANVLVGVTVATAKADLNFHLKQYGITLQSNDEKIRNVGDINNKLVFEGKIDVGLGGKLWFGLQTRAITPGQELLGFGIEKTFFNVPLVSQTLTTEFNDPMGAIRSEYARIKREISSKAECVVAGAYVGAVGGMMGTLGGGMAGGAVLGGMVGAAVCGKVPPFLQGVINGARDFLEDPLNTSINEVGRWLAAGKEILDKGVAAWHNFVDWAKKLPGGLGDVVAWVAEKYVVARKWLGEGLDDWVGGFGPGRRENVLKIDINKTDFGVSDDKEQITIDLSQATGNVTIGIKGNDLIVIGRDNFKSLHQPILEYQYKHWKNGQYHWKLDTGRGEGGYEYADIHNANAYQIPINSRLIKIIGGNGVESVSFSSPDGANAYPNIWYKGTGGKDVVYTEINGLFDLGDGENTFRTVDSKNLFLKVRTGSGADTVFFGTGFYDWADTGGVKNTVITDKGNDFSRYVMEFGSEGRYDVFGGGGVEDISAYGATVYADLGGGNDKAFGVGLNSVVWLRDGNDEASVSGENAKVYGEGGNDTLKGSSFSDFLDGGDGDNYLWGHDGDDVLMSGIGASTLVGGKGNDFLSSTEGATRFIGSEISQQNLDRLHADFASGSLAMDAVGGYGIDQTPANDFIYGNDQDNLFVLGLSQKGAGFIDRMKGFGPKFFFGDSLDDDKTARQKADANLVVAGKGNDFIFGGNGREIVQFNSGKKNGFLQGGNDFIVTMDGGVLNLDLGNGDDVIVLRNLEESKTAEKGSVTIDGGPGSDTLYYTGTQGAENWTLDKKQGNATRANTLDDLAIGTQGGATNMASIENLFLDLAGGNDQVTINWAPIGSKLRIYLGEGNDLATVNFDSASGYGIQVRGGTQDKAIAGQDTIVVNMKVPGALTRDLGNGGQFGTVMGSYAKGAISYIEYVGMRASTPGMNLAKAYIQSIYHNTLRRNGSVAEVNRWVATLASFGVNGVMKRMMESEEFSRLTVADWYQQYLGRSATLSEMRPWIDMLKGGKSLEQVLPELIASPEYFNRNGGTLGSFVRAVYRDFLERTPETVRVNSWIVPLSDKMARQDMVRQVMISEEYRRLAVQRNYTLFLRRGEALPGTLEFPQRVVRKLPTQGELNAWTSTWENLSRVRNSFVASKEFFWFGR